MTQTKIESESKSENTEFIISFSEDDSSDLSGDDINSVSCELKDCAMSSVRIWFEIKTVYPAPPCFKFTENLSRITLINILCLFLFKI